MTHSTLERPLFTPETSRGSHLSLDNIKVVERLPERSPFELRTIAPTADRPVAVYLATPKDEDPDTMKGSLIAIKESIDAPDSMEVFWQADPDAMSVVRTCANDQIEQMGAGDDESIAGKFKIKKGDKLFFMTNQRLAALKASSQFTKDGIDLVLNNENERQEIIEITLDGVPSVDSTSTNLDAASVDTSMKPGEPSIKQQLIERRKLLKAQNDRQRAKEAKAPSQTDSSASTVAPPAVTVTPLIFAQSKRAPIPSPDTISHPAVATDQEVDDEERQQEIDAKRGFTVINKRVRSREELLYTPLDDLIAGIDANKNTNTDDTFVPSPDGHEPLVYGPENRPAATPAVDPDAKEKFSFTGALNDALGKMHARFSTAYFMRQNNRQPRNPEKEKRLKKVAVWATMGAVGIVAWKMNPEWQNSFGDALDTIVPGATDAVNETFPGAINTGEGQQAQGQGSSAESDGAGTRQSEGLGQGVVDQNLELLKSAAHIIPNGGGGEAYALANGADPRIWYQNEVEFLRLFPNESMPMSDGHIGFRKPGELSNEAKEYWLKKFGQWR